MWNRVPRVLMHPRSTPYLPVVSSAPFVALSIIWCPIVLPLKSQIFRRRSFVPSSYPLFVPTLRTLSFLIHPGWVSLLYLPKFAPPLSADPRLIPFPLGSIAMRQGLVFKYPARGWNGVPLNTSLAVNDSTSTHACRCTLACMQSSLDPSIYVQVV